MHAPPAASRKTNIEKTYCFIAPYSLIHNFVRGQQLGGIPFAGIVQRTYVIVEVDAAAKFITDLLGLVRSGYVLACQKGTVKVCTIARAPREGHPAADKNKAVPVQAAIDFQIAVNNQDSSAGCT